MKTSKITGIVLKRINFGESDKVITLFTKERGKLSVVAKGIRRIKSRRAPHLEPLNEVALMLHRGKNFEIITEAKTVTPFVMQNNFKSLGFAFYAAEVIDKLLPENEPHEQVYWLLEELLKGKNLEENKIKEFTAKLLWQLGFLPFGHYPKEGLTSFVESVAERRIKSKKIIEEL
ncbi:DNA repair protein RecO [Patescibacteria group bacterium]|nr:DNA repair protein RecO [Patescibacteria group bacterium]